MSSPTPFETGPRARKFSAGYCVLAALVLLLGASALGIIGLFHLGSEATVLRTVVMNSVPGQWDKKIALRVGWVTTALVRTGSRFFNLPPEPRAALDAVRGVEVGVYKLREGPGSVGRGAILTHADKAMAARGWDRVVGVVQEHELVAVYMPRKGVLAERMKCCVAVFSGRDLVIVSARGNLEPLWEIAQKRMNHEMGNPLFAWR